MKNVLEIKQLSFSYQKGAPVLSNLDLQVKEGSVLAILGRNGCGKSTLLDLVIGYQKPDAGEILINGRGIVGMSEKELARSVSYVPQNAVVGMDFSVRDFVLFGRNCHISMFGSPNAADCAFAEQCAADCGIEHLLDRDINKVSGGERQLACVARALAQDSPLVLMDEPTASLDFGNQAKMLKLIQTLQKTGKTIVFTTHNPNHVMDLCCEVAVMGEGRIFANDKAQDVICVELLRRLYGVENITDHKPAYSFV